MAGSGDVQCLLFLSDISSFIFLRLGRSVTAPYPISLLYNGLPLFLSHSTWVHLLELSPLSYSNRKEFKTQHILSCLVCSFFVVNIFLEYRALNSITCDTKRFSQSIQPSEVGGDGFSAYFLYNLFKGILTCMRSGKP